VPALVKKTSSPQTPSQKRPQSLQAASLKKIPWLVHGFSTRLYGLTTCYGGRTLNLGFTKDDKRLSVEKNRESFLTALGAKGQGRTRGHKSWPLTTLRQLHSDIIHVVHEPVVGPLAGDGFTTNAPNIALGILTADCFPVILVDKKNRAVGAFHAGWRGTVARIVEKGLGIMRHRYGSLPQDIYAAIGPGIQKCCYEVGEELKSSFQSQFDYADELFHEVFDSNPVHEKYPLLFLTARAPGHSDLGPTLHLDLQEANRRQLLSAGVPEKQIEVLNECTACNVRKFFSHRSEKGFTGRMMAIVGIHA